MAGLTSNEIAVAALVISPLTTWLGVRWTMRSQILAGRLASRRDASERLWTSRKEAYAEMIKYLASRRTQLYNVLLETGSGPDHKPLEPDDLLGAPSPELRARLEMFGSVKMRELFDTYGRLYTAWTIENADKIRSLATADQVAINATVGELGKSLAQVQRVEYEIVELIRTEIQEQAD